MSSSDYSITLRIRHPNIDPTELTRQIGFAPQHAWRAGEQRQLDNGEPATGVYRETYWVGLLPELRGELAGRREPLAVGSETVDETLPAVTLHVALMKMKRAAAFWQRLAEQGGTVECLVQIQRDERCQLELSPALLAALAELRIALSVEVELTQSHAVAAA
jgi:hypothetical protein